MQVTIVTRPEMTVFVRTFGGFAKDKYASFYSFAQQ